MVTRQPQVERRTAKVRLSETDVLPRHVWLYETATSWIAFQAVLSSSTLIFNDFPMIKNYANLWRIGTGSATVANCQQQSTADVCIPFLRYSASSNGATLKSGLGIVQAHWKWYHSKAWVRFNYGRILHRFWDEARYWSKIAILSYPTPAFDAPVRGNIVLWFGAERVEWWGDGEKSLRICLAISTEYLHVTDGRTDRHLSTE